MDSIDSCGRLGAHRLTQKHPENRLPSRFGIRYIRAGYCLNVYRLVKLIPGRVQIHYYAQVGGLYVISSRDQFCSCRRRSRSMESIRVEGTERANALRYTQKIGYPGRFGKMAFRDPIYCPCVLGCCSPVVYRLAK